MKWSDKKCRWCRKLFLPTAPANLFCSLLCRFWFHVDKSGSCWMWDGALDDDGYGRIDVGGKGLLAHRVAWEIGNGSIPKRLCVCHRCDNPPCVRLSHLFLGTIADNMADRNAKHRQAWGSRVGRSKLTLQQVAWIRSHYRKRAADFSSIALGRRFGVHHNNILCIVNGLTWKGA